MANWSVELPETASEGDKGHVDDHNLIVGAVSELRGVVDDVEKAAADEPSWEDVTGKPSTFPANDHNHAVADVTDLEDRLKAIEQRLDDLEADSGESPED